jgi:hypothetical protein
MGNWDSLVCTGWTVEVRSREGKEIFLCYTAFRQALGPTQPPIQWVPEVKRLGREAEHSPPSSDEVDNGGAIRPVPIRLHCVVLVNSTQEQFTVLLVDVKRWFMATFTIIVSYPQDKGG